MARPSRGAAASGFRMIQVQQEARNIVRTIREVRGTIVIPVAVSVHLFYIIQI